MYRGEDAGVADLQAMGICRFRFGGTAGESVGRNGVREKRCQRRNGVRVLYPRAGGDLSKFMQRITLTHTQAGADSCLWESAIPKGLDI